MRRSSFSAAVARMRLLRGFDGGVPYAAATVSLCAPPINATAVAATFRFASSHADLRPTPARTRTHYAWLGVKASASADDIKTAYRQRALECHPDMVAADRKTAAETEFLRVSEAFSVLTDVKQREAYDKSIGVGRSSSPSQGAPSPRGSATTKTPATARADAAAARRAAASSGRSSSPRTSSPGRARSPSARSTSPRKQGARFNVGGGQGGLLRGQADAVFREAFQGKTIHDIVFAARYASKYGRGKTSGVETTVGAGRTTAAMNQQGRKSGDRGARYRRRGSSGPAAAAGAAADAASQQAAAERVVGTGMRTGSHRADGLAKSGADLGRETPAEAMQTVADDVERLYLSKHRYKDPKLVRVHLPTNAGEPAPPPSEHMPFRPFAGMALPPGVTAEAAPVAEAPVALKDDDAFRVEVDERDWREMHLPPGYGNGADVYGAGTYMDTLQSRRNWPHNQGMLRSYHRPV